MYNNYLNVFLCFTALARSKSTPGLVESSGKIPLEAMMITRHHTLPAGLPKQSPSSGDEETHDENSSETGAHATTTAEKNSKNDYDENCDVINVGTMTSPDSYTGGITPSQHSFRLPGYSPPISPRSLCQTPNIPTISAATPVLTNAVGSPAQLSPLSFSYTHTYPFASHPQQMNFLSPYCVSNTMNPLSSPSLATSRSDNLSSSHINLSPQNHTPQPSLLPISPGYNISNFGSVSPQSFSYDTPNDILLKEINTLRERLISLETENASMTAKLHRQQWDVEHRLSELELHMCQSSSQASTSSHDDRIERFEPVSRESII